MDGVPATPRAAAESDGPAPLFLGALLLFAVFHFVLRYILRFSDDATAVGYRDAPAWFKVLKDVALAACVVAVTVAWRSPWRWRSRWQAQPRPVRLLVLASLATITCAGVAALATIALDRASTEDALLHTFRYPF